MNSWIIIQNFMIILWIRKKIVILQQKIGYDKKVFTACY